MSGPDYGNTLVVTDGLALLAAWVMFAAVLVVIVAVVLRGGDQ